MSYKMSDNPMSVDIDARHNVSIFDIFERIELIPLETTDESIFHLVGELHYFDGVLYILDNRSRIFAFDASGKFLFKIDDRGQGPEEYLHISDFEIDSQMGKMLVLDPLARNLIKYDLSGKHLRRTRLPEIVNAYNRLRYLGDGVIAFWTFDSNNRLKFYDRNIDSIFQEHSPATLGDNVINFFLPRVFSYGNFLMKEAAFDNNIYEVFPDGTYSIAYTWDFGRLNNSASMAEDFPERIGSREEFIRWNERVRSSVVVNYFFLRMGGNQTYRYAQIVRKEQYINLFHNISKGHTYVFTEFSEGATFYPIFWSDEFVIGLGPFAGYREETIPDAILDERNIEIKRNICEFDNPVLIKYFFRR